MTPTLLMPEFTMLESGKSIRQYLPPNGTEPIVRFSVSSLRTFPRAHWKRSGRAHYFRALFSSLLRKLSPRRSSLSAGSPCPAESRSRHRRPRRPIRPCSQCPPGVRRQPRLLPITQFSATMAYCTTAFFFNARVRHDDGVAHHGARRNVNARKQHGKIDRRRKRCCPRRQANSAPLRSSAM